MNIWECTEGTAIANGKIGFLSKPFITITSAYPPGAVTCRQLYDLGFEIYIQPVKGYSQGYTTTYKLMEEK